jgi:beta-1,4-N-acetylglucosaminyltransferase
MKICLVCSHGGHLTEMLQLLNAFREHKIFFVTYYSKRAENLAKTHKTYLLKNIGRNPLRMFMSLPFVIRILKLEKPNLIISTGSEIAIPFFYLAKLFSIKTLFIESCCRINTPSSTGRMVYFMADVFLVQWRQLMDYYGRKAEYWGSIL